jgi:hypothetical protein
MEDSQRVLCGFLMGRKPVNPLMTQQGTKLDNQQVASRDESTTLATIRDSADNKVTNNFWQNMSLTGCRR